MHLNNKAPRRKTESGYALIVVLLVITVFSILGLTVMSVSFNHSKQFSKETTQTQALNVAEMGLKAYDKKINLNIDGLAPFDVSQFQSKLETSLPQSLNSSTNSTLNSMQGNPSYIVTRGNVGTPSKNLIPVIITSQGTVNGQTQIITQTKTFKYQTVSSGNSGDPNYTPEYMGLSLPYVNGSFHNGYLSWLSSDYQPKWISEGTLVHHGDFWINNNIVYIDGKQVTTADTIHQDVDLSQVKNLFLGMPLDYPANQPLAGASLNNESNINQVNYNNDVNFSSFNLTDKNPNVTINGKAYINSSINTGNLKSGTITFNDDIAINGDLNAGNNVIFIFKKNVYINGAINASNQSSLTFEKSLYINGSNINLNNNSSLYVGGNTRIQNAGSLNGSGNATFNGNIYFNHDYNSTGNNHFNGYVFINGSFNNSGPLTFERTVYVQGDFYPKGKGYIVNFKQGVITAGNNASPETSGSGKILIGPQQHGGNNGSSGSGGSSAGSGSSPVTVTTSNTKYQ